MAEKEMSKKLIKIIKAADKLVQDALKVAEAVKELKEGKDEDKNKT